MSFVEAELERIIKALEHYHAYTVAANREDVGYKNLADNLKRKPVGSEAADARKLNAEGDLDHAAFSGIPPPIRANQSSDIA